MARIDHQHARRIFEEALGIPADARPGFLRDRCGSDDALLRRVLRLLQADRTAAGFLEKPAIGPPPAPEAYVGQRVGRYRLTRLLGRGGMGRVYEAQQDHPSRTVALKIVGALPTAEMRRRFRYECEALGKLSHPGIAAIYESFSHPDPLSGEELPCFAMELVPGAQPIGRYAASAGVSDRDRVALIAQAADAVHHAHQRGVIHRDLKPANILVSPEGVVKLIDFGVARPGDAAGTRFTMTGQLVGTLAYMSPEQVAGDASSVDLRSDVYSLGVVLYELLSGRLPYELDSSSVLDAGRVIRDTPPTRLRSAHAHAPGDLEAVVLKALSKNPDERYQSAADLAADLRRWLAREPVRARPPSPWRLVRHFWRRHRVIASAAALTLAALVLGLAGAATGLVRVTVARDQARQAQQDAVTRLRASEQTSQFLIRVLAGANPFQMGELGNLLTPESVLPADPDGPDPGSYAGMPGRGASAFELLRLASRELHTAIPRDRLGKARIQAGLGEILTNCGLLDEALPHLREAHQAFLDLLGPDNLETARAAEWLATASEQFAVSPGTIQLRAEALQARERAHGPNDPRTLRAALALALARARAGDASAESDIRLLLERAERSAGARSRPAAEARIHLANALTLARRPDEAAEEAARALALTQELGQGDGALGALAQTSLAQALREAGRFEEAEFHARGALDKASALPGSAQAAGLGPFQYELERCLVGQRRWADAAQVARQNFDSTLSIYGPDHHATFKQQGRLGYLELRAGRTEQAAELLSAAAGSTRGIGEAWRAQWYEAHLAEAFRRLGRPREAIELIARLRAERVADAADAVPPAVQEPDDALRTQLDLIQSLALADIGRADESRALRERALALIQRLGVDARRALLFDAADAPPLPGTPVSPGTPAPGTP